MTVGPFDAGAGSLGDSLHGAGERGLEAVTLMGRGVAGMLNMASRGLATPSS